MSSQSKMFQILDQYVFTIENLSDSYKCMFCSKILIDAKQTSCGCKACNKCFINYLKDGPKPCPSKLDDCLATTLYIGENIYQDNATNRDIGNLFVTCPLKPCSHQNNLRYMADHIETCKHREIRCTKCDMAFCATDKEQHEQSKCDFRNYKCPDCNDSMTFKMFKDKHRNSDCDDLCEKYESICPNECSVKIKVNLKSHLKKCENKKLECPFHSLDCNLGKMTKARLTQHLHEEFCSHISSLINQVKSSEKKIEQLIQNCEHNYKLLSEHYSIHEKLDKNYLMIESTIEEYKKRVPPPIQTIVDKNEIFRNGSFIWKFVDFDCRRNQAENNIRLSITSEPFYTSEFGYKMCLRIYPYGDGIGKGSYLSVFFAIMKGDFDDLLSWPFKQKVTLTIFDQETGTKHHSDTFKPDARSPCYQKPNEECNVASGSPRFIALSLLTANDSIYCKNDTLYLKINVDTVGISKP